MTNNISTAPLKAVSHVLDSFALPPIMTKIANGVKSSCLELLLGEDELV